MTLPQIIQKIKLLPDLPREGLIIVLFSSVALAGYLIGRIEANEENHQKSLKLSQYAVETPIFAQVVEVATSSQKQAVSAQKTVIKGSFVASKSGKAYHLPWCSGAKRIKEENKIWFQTKEEAEKAGYHPAGNCEGL